MVVAVVVAVEAVVEAATVEAATVEELPHQSSCLPVLWLSAAFRPQRQRRRCNTLRLLLPCALRPLA